MKKEKLIGRILFDADANRFFEVVSVFPPEPEFQPIQRLKLIDLADGKENVTRFLEEIGQELIVIPHDYPRSNIDCFLTAKGC